MKTKETNADVIIVYVHNGKAITEAEAKKRKGDFPVKDISNLVKWCKICTRPNAQTFIYIHSSKPAEVDVNALVSKY